MPKNRFCACMHLNRSGKAEAHLEKHNGLPIKELWQRTLHTMPNFARKVWYRPCRSIQMEADHWVYHNAYTFFFAYIYIHIYILYVIICIICILYIYVIICK